MQAGNGQHWFCLIRTAEELIELFDSLGSTTEFIKEKLNFKVIYEFNSTAVQTEKSTLCGQFCVFFVLNRLMNLDSHFEEIVNDLFEEQSEKNDTVVQEFVNNLMN